MLPLLPIILLLTTPLLPQATAYYHLGTRSKRNEWFENYPSYAAGSRISDTRDISKCILYTNTKDRGGVNAVTIYNQPGLGTSAPVFAFYEDTVCGAAQGRSGGRGTGAWKSKFPAAKPIYVAVLDKSGTAEGVDGVWLINLLQGLGREPTFKTMKALDYEAEMQPGGLLAGTENDPARVIYKWNTKTGVREAQYITGAVTKLEEPGGIIEQLTTSSNMYMALRDLTERALRPGSENIPNPLPEYFRKVVNGEIAEGLTAPFLGEDINSPTDIRRKKIESRRRSRKQRIENPQGLNNLMSAIEREQDAEVSDTSAQIDFEDFLESMSDDEQNPEERNPEEQIPEEQIPVSRNNAQLADIPTTGIIEEILMEKETQAPVQEIPIEQEEEVPTYPEQTQEEPQIQQTGEQEDYGDLYMDVMDANIPPDRGFEEEFDAGYETPDEQRLVKAKGPAEPPDVDARARAFQRFMNFVESKRQEDAENFPIPVNEEGDLSNTVTPVTLRIRPDSVSIIPNSEAQQVNNVPANRPPRNNQLGPQDAIVISSGASAEGEQENRGDAMEEEVVEVVNQAQTEKIPPQEDAIEEEEPPQSPQGLRETLQLQNLLPPNQDDSQIDRISAVDAIQEEDNDVEEIQQPQQPRRQSGDVFLSGYLSPQARTWESMESARSSRFQDMLRAFQPETWVRQSMSTTGRPPPPWSRSRHSEQSLPAASLDDIENPQPEASASNANDQAALENLIEIEDQLPGERSFEDYQAFVPGRRRGSPNQSS
ncbi:hypothetical protein TWF481_007997 [Arthrobotrys musiformis]|uniref:Uncharacterized protein n=1 Tax=Arthrobotrys musiformis TaxID=47236 RepID=A0AAV9W8D8_9PEZI